jgi:transposase
MTKSNPNETIEIMAIDFSKNSFQLHGVDRQGRKIMGKKLTRRKTFEFMAKLEPCTVVMEACGSAHYWARLFQMYGHQTKLIAPQFVKPFVKSNKNDAADAAAIAGAAQRPDMRFVAIKSIEQQDNQCIHRIRSQAVRNRTSLINQIRGLLLEYGVDIPKGRAKVREQLPYILEDTEYGLSHRFRFLLADLQDELIYLNARVSKYNKEIENMVNNCELAKQLLTIPGIGPQTATALLACIGNINMFKSGREMAAFFGLVPRQHSTGGNQPF